MTRLLDVNVLLALAWPNHVHHARAHRWFRSIEGEPWATCPATQSGFVRVSSNRRALPYARTPLEALALLRSIVSLPGHEFWVDDVDLTALDWVESVPLVGHLQLADLRLVALARRHAGSVATFDRGVEALIPPSDKGNRLVELLDGE